MDRFYSLQDELARQRAEWEAIDQRAEGQAARQRFVDYQAGKGVAAGIIGRVAAFGGTYERNTQTLRRAAAAHPDTLEGRVAAADLAEAADTNDRATPDTQAEARRIAALERLQRETEARVARESALSNGRDGGRERP